MKQYTEDDEGNAVSAYDDPTGFYERIGITEDQEITLTTTISDEIKIIKARQEEIDISQVNLEMVHIHDVTINYDYLTELIAQMADEVHENEMEKASKKLRNWTKIFEKFNKIQRKTQIKRGIKK